MSRYDVVIKKVEPIKIASVRGVVPRPNEQGPLWEELEAYLAQERVRPVGPCFTLYHDDEHKDRDWDIEVCEPIADELVPARKVHVYDLPAFDTMACVVHAGPFVTIGEAYDAILKWVDENKYHIVGPCREVYLRTPQPDGNQNDPGTVSEIEFPVEKAG